MPGIRWTITVLTLILSGAAADEAAENRVTFSSGGNRVALVELYTSEGCNSCPPADHWLSQLKSDPDLWEKFTPVALHVDYWDYIGWQDRFARREFSDRQQQYILEGGARFAYTPGFFANGQEWNGWRYGEAVHGDRANVGNLDVTVDGGDLHLRFKPTRKPARELSAHVVLVGMNIETRVKAGENSGKTLAHDFVALGATTVPLDRDDDGLSASVSLPAPAVAAPDYALVAWVSAAGQQAPLQSVGGFLPNYR